MFSRAGRVMIWLGRRSSWTSSTIRRPACLANQRRWADTAGAVAEPGRASPPPPPGTAWCSPFQAGRTSRRWGKRHPPAGHGLGSKTRLPDAAGPGLGVQVGDDGVFALEPPGQHRAARNEDGGKIQPRRRQEVPGHVLVAATDQRQPVEGMKLRACLHLGGDDVSRRGVVAHPGAAHVHRAHAEAAEFARRAAGLPDSRLHRFGDGPEVRVAGAGLAVGVRDADPRAARSSLSYPTALMSARARAMPGSFRTLTLVSRPMSPPASRSQPFSPLMTTA